MSNSPNKRIVYLHEPSLFIAHHIPFVKLILYILLNVELSFKFMDYPHHFFVSHLSFVESIQRLAVVRALLGYGLTGMKKIEAFA